MDFSGLDLNLLVAADALFAEKNVSRAGERLHLSQSATSGALARLRQAFRDPLLVQVGRKMALTPLAEALVEPVREFLLQAEAILHNSPEFDPATSTRKFRLTMSDYAQLVVLTAALARIERMAPKVTLQLSSTVDIGSEMLERGEVDLSITPTRYLSSKHPSEPLFDDEFVCVLWSGNRLVNDGISLETYLQLGHIVVRLDRLQQVSTIDEWFVEQFGHQRRIEVITTAFNLVPQLLIGTKRIATLHRRLAAYYEQYLPLKIVPPPVEIPRLEESMQWHRSRDRDPGMAWLRATLKEAISAVPGDRRRKQLPKKTVRAGGSNRSRPRISPPLARPVATGPHQR